MLRYFKRRYLYSAGNVVSESVLYFEIWPSNVTGPTTIINFMDLNVLYEKISKQIPHTLRNIPEERRTQSHGSESLKYRIIFIR